MGTALVNGLRALVMLVAANFAPWAVAQLFGHRWMAPLDLGLKLADGQRLFGAHKTWRGIAAGVIASALVGLVTGVPWSLGAAVGALSLLGDAASSAFKRRLSQPPGSELPIVDQLPEALLPLLVLGGPLGLDTTAIILVIVAFAVLDILSTRVRHRSWVV